MTQSVSSAVKAHVSLCGHLIDSLTLTKVFDLILANKGEFKLTDIQIGRQKNELSFVRLTISAPDQSSLNRIMEEITPHGVKNDDSLSATLAQVADPGKIPEEIFQVDHFPAFIRFGEDWIPVESSAAEAVVIVVDKEKKTARLKKVTELTSQEWVVVGNTGIRWE